MLILLANELYSTQSNIPWGYLILISYLSGVELRVLQKLSCRLPVLGLPRQHPPREVEKHDLVPPLEDAAPHH